MLFFKGIHWIAGLLVCVLLAGKCSKNLENCVECPKPKIENGKVIGLKEVYKRGEESKFECNDGYFPRGHQRIMCQDDCTWSNNPPFCQKISCPYPAKPHNGFVRVQNISLPGDSAKYECDKEYEIEGEDIVNCSHNGTWVPNEVPSCSQIKVTSCHYGYLAWIIPLSIILPWAVLGIICWKQFCKDRCQGCNAGEHLLEAFIRLIPLPCLPARRNQGRNSGSDGDDSVSIKMIPGIKGEDSEEEVSPETLPAT